MPTLVSGLYLLFNALINRRKIVTVERVACVPGEVVLNKEGKRFAAFTL